ncbi:Gm12394 [Phodopus roborovskii]|uniref:Gm12394 protein n=1 Tax=Phodopus roborovskii TaxID=109678 RepID=A0AAU9ZCA0_PHORO|nr:Gm12394 [Phodopus roborovskii]
MKSQSWLPTEGNVRQLLCVDPCCQICDAATLEIQQLLESDKSQISPALLGLPQGSSCLDMLPISSVPFEQNMDLYSRHSRHLSLASGTPTLAQLTEHLTQSTSAVSVQQYWADHIQLDQKFHLADMPMISETVVSSRLEDPVVLMVEEKLMQNEPKLGQESQDQHPLKSSVSLLSLNPKITNLTRSMSLHMDSVLSSHVPLLSPEVRRLLELHVKKWIHFQKWGLPKRVEESLRQLMPDPTLFCQSRKTLLSSFLSSGSEVSMNKTGTISHQSCWISEWSVIKPKQRKHWHQILDYLPSHEEHLSGCSPPSKAQTKDSGSHLQSEYYSQLFCGLPSLHSESLDVTSLSTQGVSQNKDVAKPKPSSTGPQHTKEFSHPLLPKTPCKSAPPCSPASPDAKTPHEGPRITVPFLTPAECEALECHLIERQVKLQWGLPGVFLRNQYSHMLCEPHEKAETLKTCWSRKIFSHPIRKASFPEHVRRLLEFHFQKQLIHLRWGLPQRIQRSIHLLLSSTDQQALSCSSNRALPSMSIPQSETHGSGDRSTPTVDKRPIPMPHLFVQAKAMLKNHVDSKCDQIHQGKVPAQVWSSWECKISGRLAARAPFSWIQKGQHLKLQAESKSNKIVPWKPVALNQEKQALSGALIEHCKRPQALSEETIKKLETTLQHKYLAFLSGLPALYCVALSRPTSPAVTSQPRTTETMPMPVKIPSEAVTQMTLLEGPREDNKASDNITAEFQSEVQMEGRTDRQTHDKIHLLNTHILAKLNFHLKRKVLAMQFGISEKEREYKELAIVSLESESIQEFLKSLSIPESTALQTLPKSGDLPPAPDASTVRLRKQPDTAVQAVCHKQEQPRSKAGPQDSAQEVSKTSRLRNTTEAQVPNLEEALSTEPQGSGKSKYSAHVPALTEKGQEPGKPKAVDDPGEGDTGLGLSPTSERTHREGDQEPEKGPMHWTPQGSSQYSHSSHLEDPCPPSPQDASDLDDCILLNCSPYSRQ